MRPAASETWTTRRLLAWMTGAFEKRGLESARLSAELLLAHVIGCDRLRLYMESERPASPPERQRLRDLAARALAHEPVQYLVGEAWFFGLPFTVDRRVLVPRPETETIVQHVLQHVRSEPGLGGPGGAGVVFADICTGSGCIAISLLKNLPGARALGTDISADALEVGRLNAARHGVGDRIELLRGHLLKALADHPVGRANGSLHFLVANPPYIPDAEWADVPPNVRNHEPEMALRGGPDGLLHVRRLIEAGPSRLRPRGLMLVEVAESTAAQALELLRARPELEEAEVLADFQGRPRVIVGRRRG